MGENRRVRWPYGATLKHTIITASATKGLSSEFHQRPVFLFFLGEMP